MRTTWRVAVFLCFAGVAGGAQQSVSQYRFYGRWRSLARQLPGAYRFIDRLDLTEEQQKALDKAYEKWTNDRREANALALKDLPPLSKDDRKDLPKLRKYYAERQRRLQKAQIPVPVDQVEDVLSQEQLAKLNSAHKAVEVWNRWLAGHVVKHDKEMDDLLGPVSEEQPRAYQYTYSMFGRLVKGGSLLGRVGLTEEQNAELTELRRHYYREYSELMGPLWHSLRGAKLSPVSVSGIRAAAAAKGADEIRNRYTEQLKKVLTEEQLELLSKADEIARRRDAAIWERYSQYVLDLSAILPYPKPPAGKKTPKPKQPGSTD